jgi:predicted PurR-regulated permease PerM
LELAQRVLSPVLSPVETIAIVFVFAIFILLQQEDLRDRLIRLFGSGDLHRTTVALDDAGRRLSRYFLTQLSVNAAFGCVIAAGLFFIGIPSPVLWGVMGGLLRFVPYVLGIPCSRTAARACGRNRPWLGDGGMDSRAVCSGRGFNGASTRAVAVRS